MSQTGAIRLSVVLSVVLGIGFAASGFLNIVQHQRAEQEKKLMQGEITDLRFQVKKDAEGTATADASPTPEPLATPEATASPSPSPSAAVAGTAVITLNEYDGVKITTSDPVNDLTYAFKKSGAYKVVNLTSRSLVAKYPKCLPGDDTNNALGIVVRKPLGEPVPKWDLPITSVGSWTYYYVQPTGLCDPAAKNDLAQARSAVWNAGASIVKTLAK